MLAPAIVIVFSAPVPDATTPVPTKFNVVADVDNALPSSSIVIPPPDAFTVTDPPDSAVTVKLVPKSIVPAVPTKPPPSLTIIPLPEAVIPVSKDPSPLNFVAVITHVTAVLVWIAT